MKTLGTLFLITAALLVVGVIINLSPSGSEERIYKSEEALHEASQNLKNFAEAGRALGYQTGQIDIRSDRDIFSTSSSLKSQREMRVFYFAIPSRHFGYRGPHPCRITIPAPKLPYAFRQIAGCFVI